MNKVLAFSISGMGLTGAIFIISVAFLFNSPIGNLLKVVTAGSLTAFVIFISSALRIRRRLNKEAKNSLG